MIYFACTRGLDSITFASTDCRFNPMLESFGSYNLLDPVDAYNKWAEQRGINAKCVKATEIPHTLKKAWRLELEVT